ncbi:MAG: hypothetical protein WB783_08855 [Arenicellales bacterium]
MVKEQRQNGRKALKHFKVLVAAALYLGCSSWFALRADDTQIYVSQLPPAQAPNVLFTIDTSGSMDTTVPDGSQTRIEAVKSALDDIVNNTSNLKAGLERYHYELGGPIVFPVIDLDSAPSFLNDSIINSSIDRSTDDAEEYGGVVHTADTALELTQAETFSSDLVTTLELTPLTSTDDDEDGTASNLTTSSPDLDVGQVNAGIRFPLVTIPQNAVILHAEVQFSETAEHTEQTDLVLHGENVANAQTFSETGTNSVGTRFNNLTTATVPWSNVPALSNGQIVTTPNIRSIIQEVVNRSDWSLGNALAVMIESKDGHRELSTIDGGTPPILRIQYAQPGATLMTRTVSGGQGRYDAEQVGGYLYLGDTDIGLMQDNRGTNDESGFIFRDVQIPSGARVVWADMGFTALRGDTSPTSDMQVYGILDPNPPEFYYYGGDDIAGRTLTDNKSQWKANLSEGDEEIFAPAQGESFLTSNLADEINEILAKTSFTAGNNMGFVIKDDPDISGVSRREICSQEGNLYSYYSGCPEPVTARPTLNVFYTMPDSISVNQQVGLRFNNVQVPQGATITSAHLEFTVDSATTQPGTLTIDIENNTNPPTFSNTAGEKVSDRTYGASTTWTTDVWDTPGAIKQSPDISSMISSVTDQTNWCGGGSLAFRITSTDARLIAQAYDKGGSGAPTLRIKYNTNNLTAGQGCTTRKTSVLVNDSADDVEEQTSSGRGHGSIDFNSRTLSLNSDNLVGVRFQDVAVPKGANITAANLYLTADDYDTGSDTIHIYAQQSPNAPSFSRANFDVSNRIQTGDPVVDWTETTDWNIGSVYSPADDGLDLTPLISNIVNGTVTDGTNQWASGNSLVFILKSDAPYGNGDRNANSCCRGNSPVRLDISYQINLGDEPNTGQVTARQAILSTIDDLAASGWTPTVDALYEGGAYFAGYPVHFGRTRGAGQSYEASGTTNDTDLDYHLTGITDSQLLVEGDKSRLSHYATYTPSDATIVREGNCTVTDPNNRDCRTEHIDNSEAVTYVSPFTPDQKCAKGFLVLLSDGIANRDSSRDLIKTLTGRSSCPMQIPQINNNGNPIINNGSFVFRTPTSGEQCGLELADYLNKHDFIQEQNPATDVLNNVRTFTVGFNLNVQDSTENKNAVEFLKALAFVGNGGDLNNPTGNEDVKYGDDFYTADNASELEAVFESIIHQIIKETTSFVAPGISINAFNRLFNLDDIYFSLFRPDSTVAWLGNMKKFKLCTDQSTCSFGEVIDKNSQPAVYEDPTDLENYGTLKPAAQGFWSDTSDSAPAIDEGGAGEKIPTYTDRTVYVNTDSGAVPSPDLSKAVNVQGTAPHEIDLTSDVGSTPASTSDFNSLKKALFDQGNCDSGTLDEENSCLNELIEWMTGKKFVGDLPRHGNDSDVDRWAFGDPMHSRPLVLTYGKATLPSGSILPLSKIFVGTNDGGIRMINEGDGVEEWIFYPNSMLAMQSTLKENKNASHLYGVDDTPTARIHDANGNSIIEPGDGDFVNLYFGLRRGGRQVLALNVTPDDTVTGVTQNGQTVGAKGLVKPEILWRIDGGNPDFQRLGESWSTPRPVRIAGPQGPLTVLIFGGGYDPRQDGTDNDGTPPDGGDVYNSSTNGDTMGNAIFIVDANTGERLWWASSSTDGNGNSADADVSAMNTSIAAPITPLDTNKDGLIDRLYAVDLRGQVFRVDIAAAANPTNGESVLGSSTVGVLATLGSDTANDTRRKFFYAPEVAEVNDEALTEEPYELIGLISGNRSNPQGKTVQDRAYGIRDYLTDNPSAGLSSSNFPACNPLLGGCTPGTPITNDSLTDVTDQSAFVIRDDSSGSIQLTSATGTSLSSTDEAVSNLKNSYGWYFDLQGANYDSQVANPALTGEKGFSGATVLGGRMFFTTFVPPDQTADTTDACSVPEVLGTSRFYAVDFFTGAPAFDRNGDNTYDKAERFTGLGSGPSADIVPAFLPGGVVLPVPTGAGAIPENPGPLTAVNKTFWVEEE